MQLIDARIMPRKAKATEHLPFERIQTARVFEEVTAQIRQMIMSGKLKPGDRLPPERDLAAQLGVSRSSIREAFRGLEIAGLVKLYKGGSGGAFIAQLTSEVVVTALQDMFHLGTITPEQLTDARLWIEAIVVKVAVERLTEVDLGLMEVNLNEAEKAFAAGNYEACARITFEFHNILARTTRNPVLIANVSGMINIMHHYIGIIGPPQSKYILKSRRRFISYLRERNAPMAVAEMEDLLRRAHRHYLSQLEKPPVVANKKASAA
jgi:GntR family transcriptional regulator, transcriptional repressor for pyruvate dehydrogenase complex